MIHQLKPSFAGGEVSPAMYGRVDLSKYDNSMAELTNFIVLRSGGIANRPGTKFVAQTAGNKTAVLLPFRYNAEQNYIIEVTAGKIRFYNNQEIICGEDGGIYELDNDFLENELMTIKCTQSADVMFLVQPNHPPMTLTRYAHANWRYEKAVIANGPYDDPMSSGDGDSIVRQVEYDFHEAGSHSLELPEGTVSVYVEAAGGGGGGGGAFASSYYGAAFCGGDGGSGEVVRRTLAIGSERTMAVVVGAGGAAGSNEYASESYYGSGSSGSAGGPSSVSISSSTVTARGGLGGGAGYKHGDDNNGDTYAHGSNGTSYGSGGAGGSHGVATVEGRTDDYDGNAVLGAAPTAGRAGWVTVRCTVASSNIPKVSASALEGNVTLTATAELFTPDDVGTLVSLTHYVESQYKKGNPLNDNLEVDVLPKSSAYIESFGFWDGTMVVEKYDEKISKWVKIREQSGNRTQNYNFTEKNERDVIVKYRVRSDVFNTNVWSNENENQRGYVTVQAFGNDYEGEVRITSYTSPTQVAGTVTRKLASTEGTWDYSLGAWSKGKGYPMCVGFYEDRLIFAGSRSKPQTFWASKTGDYFNFGTSIPTLDDDAVTATLNSGQMNGIKAMITFDKIIMMTSGGEYLVGGEGSKAMSPSSVNSSPQEYRGINDVEPVTVGNRIVFIQQQGNIVRDLGYQYDVDKYTGSDLNILADHLFAEHKIVRMTYQQVPNSVVWCVRDDGVLLGLTYIKEQDVFAWHKHVTDGRIIDVCCIAGLNEDELWCVVERDGKYFVERMEHRNDTLAADEQYFVDCGVTVRDMTDNTVSGLEHLAGRAVNVLADGNVITGMQVSDEGVLTLSRAYSVVHVGIPYEAKAVTLPIEINGQDGTFMSRKKRLGKLSLLFRNSRGGRYGLKPSSMDEIKWRSNEAYNTAIELFNGIKDITMPAATWEQTVQITVIQTNPLPLTVLALIPAMETGG